MLRMHGRDLTIDKPHAPATARNREPILAELRTVLAGRRRVLEIGSGTGEHAVHFAAALPQLIWQCSDLPENLPGISTWLKDAALPNTPPPLALDVTADTWPAARYDAVFSANTLHIMGWEAVVTMFRRLPEVLEPDAVLAVYGPFHRDGAATSASNAAFDAQLRARDPRMGVRDAAAVDVLAAAAGLRLIADIAMPSSNALRVWKSGEVRP
jgi:cyclopropane fatty-acyl-phospholipid synthase-like methyltransferase